VTRNPKQRVVYEFQVRFLFVAVCTWINAEGKNVLPKAKKMTEERRKNCDQEFQKRKEWRICVTTDPQIQNATVLAVNDRSYATACHYSMLARWLDQDLRCADSSSNSAFRWPRFHACLATAASFPFPVGIQPTQGVQRRTADEISVQSACERPDTELCSVASKFQIPTSWRSGG
jgi:hypothetical protein